MQERSFYTTGGPDFERLLALGFSEAEALRLIRMRDHVSEQIEYREMLEESRRLSFIRWLIENNRISS
jgi:rRNA processing protein Krr1/Pno1